MMKCENVSRETFVKGMYEQKTILGQQKQAI